MEHAPLGRSGLEVSRVGFGCAAIGGHDYGAVDDATSIAAVHRALELGVTFFDTADVYGLGHAEEVLRQALEGRGDGAVVATKVGVRWNERGAVARDLSPAWIARAVEGSLRRLGVEQIHLLQLHWPDPATPLEATLEAVAGLVEAGKVLHLGVCNFTLEMVERAQGLMRVESLQVPYNLADREHEATLRACAERHGMLVMTYNSLAQGLFTGKYDSRSEFAGTDLRQRSALFQGERLERNLRMLGALRQVAARRGTTPAQTAVRWLLDQPGVGCVLTGIKTPRQAEENAAAAGWRLDDDDLALLAAAASELDVTRSG
ncbi:MAG TPA: aldo/keto reductase [Longimicrobium sp.]|nr:aldo/keto reductase [Longimicrobium sp.]